MEREILTVYGINTIVRNASTLMQEKEAWLVYYLSQLFIFPLTQKTERFTMTDLDNRNSIGQAIHALT